MKTGNNSAHFMYRGLFNNKEINAVCQNLEKDHKVKGKQKTYLF